MDSIGDRQKVRLFSRVNWRAVTTGVLGAAAVGAALLFTAGEAHAAPVSVPGIGEFDIPNEIVAQLGIPVVTPEPVPADNLTAVPAELAEFEFRPVTIPGVGEVGDPRSTSIPDRVIPAGTPEVMPSVHQEAIPVTAYDTVPAQAVSPDTAPAGAYPESRSVTIAGLGSFAIPAGLPMLTGIPGVTDSAALPEMLPAATPKRSAGARALEAAESQLGAAYRSGGTNPDGFDCSGLVQWSYAQAGVDVPRTSYSQLAAGTEVPLDELQPGDLVSFYGGGHSALYAGDGKVIHASTYGTGVTVSSMDRMPVTGARRF
ncbi:C40 family peptidase [Nocardia sp. NPDC088792]|uniref:C40 family peptidase n=1 Tax=Nocardia sp. NPDC088792 TaxID=3364332 RepID=UPI0038195F3D